MKLSARNLISINDLSRKDILKIFKLTQALKAQHKKGKSHRILKGKSLAMLFAKPSTRTRVSFEAGMTQLGGHAQDLSSGIQFLSNRESLKDTGAVLGRYVDAVMARLHSHQDIIDLAEASEVPVINGLTDLLHPCQALADLWTISEKKGLAGTHLVFVGDGTSNVCHSLMQACYKLGVKMTIACPKEYQPKEEIMKNTRYETRVTDNAKEAVKDADVIYTDTWVSMGQEKQERNKVHALKPYQVNPRLIVNAPRDCIVMHCLPAHRGQEITDNILDGSHSVVIDQAENRLHVQKAVLALLLK